MYITVKDLSEKYKISRQTVNNYMKQGMPFIRVGPRKPRFDPDKVAKWVETHFNND